MRSQIRFTKLAAWGVVLGVALGSLPLASAQQMGSGTTSTSAFGSRTLGGSSTANRTGRSTGASNSSNSLSGVGGAAQGAGGTGTGTGTTPTGGERYVRGNRQGAFVGADSSEASNSYSQAVAGGQGAMGGMGGLGGGMGNQMMMQAMRNQQQQNQQGKQQNGKNQLRPQLKAGFDIGPSLTTAFTSRQAARYLNLPALKGKGNIAVVMEGDTLVLQGQVQSAADRKLAEDLLSLEPEVTQVRNELEIVPRASSAPELNPPARASSFRPTSSRSNSLSSNSLGAGSSAPASVPRRVSQPLER
jgi:hypothetical protein